ncbi:MAG: PQQ-binding-like beta-propeller repeat protein [Planctomycetaceae bacterium]|nr:PQQ-binding-like beta-propeller repeat protein [Planctomycetaceae bacterium]
MGQQNVAGHHRAVGLLFLSIVAAVLQPETVCEAQGPAAIQETVSLDVDPSVVRKLASVRDYAGDGQWPQAVSLIREVAARHSETLISPEPGQYVSVGMYCNLLVCSLPPEGLAVYRQQVDTQAGQWLEQGGKYRDNRLLERLVREAFASSQGDDALLLLGEAAWEQGQPAVARALWTSILPLPDRPPPGTPLPTLRFPDTDLPQAEIFARLILCSLAEGDLPRAREELRLFRVRFPEYRGTLAGQTGILADLLSSLLQQKDNWPAQETRGTVSTFALSSDRNGSVTDPPDVGTVRWTVPLPGPRLSVLTRPGAPPQAGPLSWYPAIWDSLVLANDGSRVFAWNLFTGRPAWSEGIESPHPVDDAIIYQSSAEDADLYPAGVVEGVPRYTLTIDQGRLFARMGTPLTTGFDDPIRTFRSEIVCLDLQQGQGRLLWKMDASDLPVPEGLRGFEGTPVADGNRVYVSWRSNRPQTEIHVACLRAADGTLLWNRRVCAVAPEATSGRKVAGHRLLTVGAGRVYCSTDSGAIAALDASDGSLLWVRTYPGRFRAGARLVEADLSPGLVPCLYHQDRIYAAPADSDSLFCLDASSGRLVWSQTVRGGISHLIAALRGRLIVAGHRLWGIDLETGQIAWHTGFDDPDAGSYGRGAVAGQLVYWPTREEIFVVDVVSGRIERRVQLQASHGEQGGNLTIADGHLLIAGPQKLVAFSQYSRLRRQFGEELSSAPASPLLWLKLGLLEDSAGNFTQAEDAWEQALKHSSSETLFRGRPPAETIRPWLARARLAAAARNFTQGEHDAAVRQVNAATRDAPPPHLAIRSWNLLAEIELARNRPVAAIVAWRNILRLREQLRQRAGPVPEPLRFSPVADSLTERDPQSSKLLQAAPRGLQRIEQTRRLVESSSLQDCQVQAEAAVRAALESGDPAAALLAVTRVFPDEPAGWQAIWNLTRDNPEPLQRDSGAMVLRELRTTSTAAAESFRRLAVASTGGPYFDLLQDAGLDRPAPSPLETAEENQPQATAPADSRPPAARSLPEIREVWRLPLSAGRKVILPESPAASDISGFLVCGDQTSWHRARDGTTVFQLPDGLQPQLAWQIGRRLIVSDRQQQLVAVSTRNGKVFWNRITAPAATATSAPGPASSDSFLPWQPRGSTMLLARERDELTAWSLVDGARLWSLPAGSARLLTDRPSDLSSAVLLSASRSGSQLLQLQHDGPVAVATVGPVIALAGCTNSRIILLTADGSLTAVRSETGQAPVLLWEAKSPVTTSHAPPALHIAGEVVIIVSDGHTLLGFDLENGSQLWQRRVVNAPDVRLAQRLTTMNGQLVLCAEGKLQCFSTNEGRRLWRQPWLGSAEIPQQCHLVENMLLCLPGESSSGQQLTLGLLDVTTGEPLCAQHLRGLSGKLAIHLDPPAIDNSGHAPGGLLIAGNGIVRLSFGHIRFPPADSSRNLILD